MWLKSWQVVLLNVYDVMVKAVMVVPRVETKLYSEWVSMINVTVFLYASLFNGKQA